MHRVGWLAENLISAWIPVTCECGFLSCLKMLRTSFYRFIHTSVFLCWIGNVWYEYCAANYRKWVRWSLQFCIWGGLNLWKSGNCHFYSKPSTGVGYKQAKSVSRNFLFSRKWSFENYELSICVVYNYLDAEIILGSMCKPIFSNVNTIFLLGLRTYLYTFCLIVPLKYKSFCFTVIQHRIWCNTKKFNNYLDFVYNSVFFPKTICSVLISFLSIIMLLYNIKNYWHQFRCFFSIFQGVGGQLFYQLIGPL